MEDAKHLVLGLLQEIFHFLTVRIAAVRNFLAGLNQLPLDRLGTHYLCVFPDIGGGRLALRNLAQKIEALHIRRHFLGLQFFLHRQNIDGLALIEEFRHAGKDRAVGTGIKIRRAAVFQRDGKTSLVHENRTEDGALSLLAVRHHAL